MKKMMNVQVLVTTLQANPVILTTFQTKMIYPIENLCYRKITNQIQEPN